MSFFFLLFRNLTICCVCIFKQGFGGKFGVQKDRMDKSAIGFQENPDKIGTNYTKTKPDIGRLGWLFKIVFIY